MGTPTAARIDHSDLYARLFGPDWAARGVVTEDTGCRYVHTWRSPDGGIVREYQRTAPEHDWNAELTACKRCGARIDFC